MKFLLSFILIVFASVVHAQQSIRIQIVDHEGVGIPGVVISSGGNSLCVSDSSGYCNITGLSAGSHQLEFTRENYKSTSQSFSFPLTGGIKVTLEEAEEHGHEEEQVIIQSTRTSRTIANSPTRVEVISGEELDEKGNFTVDTGSNGTTAILDIPV